MGNFELSHSVVVKSLTASLWGGRRMAGEIAQPVVSLLLCRQHLASAHAGGENGNPVFAGLISAGLSQDGPVVGLGQILRNASASPVIGAQSRLGQDVSLLRRQREPS